MKKLFLLFLLTLSVGCTAQEEIPEEKLNIVATTTMLQDLLWEIGGETIQITGLCHTGVDPHSYEPTYQDTEAMSVADVILYNGFHLEGQIGELLASLESEGIVVLSLEKAIPAESLLLEEGNIDPHIWWDTSLWSLASTYVTEALCQLDPDNTPLFQENLESYLQELALLEEEIFARVAEIPEEKRVLVTAHDAFGYFGKAYGFEVLAIQGINTETEAGTGDISALATFIAQEEIKCIFTETSVNDKSILALEEAVRAKGFQVVISTEPLYSDSLGGNMSYIETAKANMNHIIDGLS